MQLSASEEKKRRTATEFPSSTQSAETRRNRGGARGGGQKWLKLKIKFPLFKIYRGMRMWEIGRQC